MNCYQSHLVEKDVATCEDPDDRTCEPLSWSEVNKK